MILFFITFVSVFLLGFQQQNVQHGYHIRAAVTSFCIAFSQFTIYRASVNSNPEGWVYMGLGGAIGIVLSMYTHKKMRERGKE